MLGGGGGSGMAVMMAVRLRGQLGEVTSGQLRRAAPPGELRAQGQLLGHLVDHVQDLARCRGDLGEI